MAGVNPLTWLKNLFSGQRGAAPERRLEEPDPQLFQPWPEGGLLVGGAVRDALLGRGITDLDWLVAQPERSASLAAGLLSGAHFALSEERGHWRVVTKDTLRDYIRPLGDLEEDLKSRDYTVNALALRQDGQLVDVTGGVADLRAGVLRMTGPEQLQADPVRLLRGVRLAVELELELEPATKAEIKRIAALHAAGSLPLPAWERSRAELDRILMSERAFSGLRLLSDTGLLDVYLPELAAGRGVDQGGFHHLDVLDHQLEAVRQLLRHFPDSDLTLRWATLLHDIGKPGTRSEDGGDSRRVRFHGHDREGAEQARLLMQRLRQPAARTERTAQLVRRHMQPLPRDAKATGRFIHRYGELLPDLLRLMVADREAARGRLASAEARKRYRLDVGRVLKALAETPAEAPEPLLSGAEIMELLGLEPGPEVGQAVRYLAELQAVGDARTVEEAVPHLKKYAEAQWGGRT